MTELAEKIFKPTTRENVPEKLTFTHDSNIIATYG